MIEKSTTFSSLIEAQFAPELRCCANCAHGMRVRDLAVMGEIVQCEALPKLPVVLPTPQGPALTFRYPMMRLNEKCGLFCPKSGSESA